MDKKVKLTYILLLSRGSPNKKLIMTQMKSDTHNIEFMDIIDFVVQYKSKAYARLINRCI
ncbi:unnamed protein product [marine sediment metagenome]|uniref:Uncharacterized protein n=1 Tax=marine sediment metagenome TaxID=412755 RepID=X1CLY8_9ZZZZ